MFKAYCVKCVSPLNGTVFETNELPYSVIRHKCSYCRLKKSNEMQQYADIYLLLNYSTCFGRPSHQSSGVHATVVAASGTEGSKLPQTSLFGQV